MLSEARGELDMTMRYDDHPWSGCHMGLSENVGLIFPMK